MWAHSKSLNPGLNPGWAVQKPPVEYQCPHGPIGSNVIPLLPPRPRQTHNLTHMSADLTGLHVEQTASRSNHSLCALVHPAAKAKIKSSQKLAAEFGPSYEQL